jgi:probable F420-dependent oxidoreductase
MREAASAGCEHVGKVGGAPDEVKRAARSTLPVAVWDDGRVRGKPEFGVVIPSWGPYGDAGAIRELVQAAEQLGFHTAWFGDHVLLPDYAIALSPANWFDALACCVFGLGATRRLRFGTDVLVLPYRDPRLLAKLAATADQLSGGRLTLAVGVGYLAGEFEALGAPPRAERGAVTDEYLHVLRLLWETDGPVSFAGKYVRFADVHCQPHPAQRPLPLWVGGNHARALRRAAELGDGWHPLFTTPAQYASGRAEIERLRGARGLAGFSFGYSCPQTWLTPDAAALPARAYAHAAVDSLPPDYDYAPEIPRAADGRPLLVGTEDQLAADLDALRQAGVEHFALRFWAGDPEVTPRQLIDQMSRFAARVLPRVG